MNRGVHDEKTEDNVVNKEQKISCTSVTDEDLEKEVLDDLDGKIELEPKMKLIVDKNR